MSPNDFASDWEEEPEHKNGSNGQFNFDELKDRMFDPGKLSEKPPAIIKLKGQVIATPGNLVSLSAQAKTGKTSVIGAMLASMFAEEGGLGDFLGIETAPNMAGEGVTFIDTEQPSYDFEQVIVRAMRRAEVEVPPSWFRAYRCIGMNPSEIMRLLEAEMERCHKTHGGVGCIYLDGIADLVPDVNDQNVCNPMINKIMELCEKYLCVIIGVIHENPGQNNQGKMRGHLGSQFERKAQSNLRIVVEEDETGGIPTYVLYTEKSRSAYIPQSQGHRFRWDEEAQMHVSVEKKEGEHKNKDEELLREMFDNKMLGMTWAEMAQWLVHNRGYKSQAGARTFIEKHLLPLLEKRGERYWPK